MSNREPGDWRIFCIIVGLFALVWSGALLLTAGEADAFVTNTQPYGGCKEAGLYPDSEGARECRNEGWIIRPHVTVSPYGEAFTDLPRCTVEDDSRCYWNALKRGNHKGEGYVAVPGRLIHVDFINGKRASNHIRGYYSIVPYHP